MRIFTQASDLSNQIKKIKKEVDKIGFVPTMGYLHEGHESLIKQSVLENQKTIVSIFVNPLQFGENEDLATYPRDLKSDLKKCEKLGVDFVFTPNESDFYNNHKTKVKVSEMSNILCGVTRPVHFEGVTTVLAKLFNITKANNVYMGQKDAQQVSIVKKMVKDLNFDLDIIQMPIVREIDGLAKSSRNKYLDGENRKEALVLFNILSSIKKIVENGELEVDKLKYEARKILKKYSKAKEDYIEIVNKNTMKKQEMVDEESMMILAIFIEKIRLIDNMKLLED